MSSLNGLDWLWEKVEYNFFALKNDSELVCDYSIEEEDIHLERMSFVLGVK